MQLEIPPGEFAATIFDLDGTLVDSMPAHYLAWDAALRSHGVSGAVDEDYFYALGGVPTHQVAELLAEHHGVRVDPDAVARLKEELYLERLASVTVIEPVVAEARRAAARHPVAIATGGLPEVAIPALEAVGLRSLFPIVITPRDVAPGRGKPEPDMFLLAAERMRVRPELCLVFEDAEPGIAAARAAGMATVRVPSRRR